MRSRIFYLYLVILITGTKSYNGDEIAKWSLGLRTLLKNCPPVPWKNPARQNFFENFRSCLQRRALVVFDAFLDEDVIPIFDGLELVRFENESSRENDLRR